MARYIAVIAQQRHKRASHSQLQHKFLQRREAEIALILDLHKIIQKTDQAENQRECQHEQMRIFAVHHALPSGSYGTECGRKHEDQSAHRRRASLGIVPVGADLTDRLTCVQCAQRRNCQFPEYKRQHKAARGNDISLHEGILR